MTHTEFNKNYVAWFKKFLCDNCFQKYGEFVIFDAPEGAFSKVDVDAVDLEKYPGLAKAPWWQAKMQAGDCLFIPKA